VGSRGQSWTVGGVGERSSVGGVGQCLLKRAGCAASRHRCFCRGVAHRGVRKEMLAHEAKQRANAGCLTMQPLSPVMRYGGT